MRNWLVQQWHDIRGHAKWALVVAAWWAITTYGAKLLRTIPNAPSWLVNLIVVVVSIALFVWLAKRGTFPPAPTSALTRTQQPASMFPTLSALLGQQPQITFDPAQFFRVAYFSPLTAEIEQNIKTIAHKTEPANPEIFYARLIGVGLVAAVHDSVWYVIFKSQLLMLNEMNRRAGVLPLLDAKAFYDRAVPTCPKVYTAYTFDQWLNYLKAQQMLIHHPTDMLEITHRTKDFLKYLAHWGRDPSMKAC